MREREREHGSNKREKCPAFAGRSPFFSFPLFLLLIRLAVSDCADNHCVTTAKTKQPTDWYNSKTVTITSTNPPNGVLIGLGPYVYVSKRMCRKKQTVCCQTGHQNHHHHHRHLHQYAHSWARNFLARPLRPLLPSRYNLLERSAQTMNNKNAAIQKNRQKESENKRQWNTRQTEVAHRGPRDGQREREREKKNLNNKKPNVQMEQ